MQAFSNPPRRTLSAIRAAFRAPVGPAMALCLAVCGFALGAEPPPALEELGIELVGIVQPDARLRALVNIQGVEECLLLGEGDLVGGYTLSKIEGDRIVLVREGSSAAFEMKSSRRIGPNLGVKTYTTAYRGDNDFHPKSSRGSSGVKKPRTKSRKAASARRSKRKRPTFIRPMEGWISSSFGPRKPPRIMNGGLGSRNHNGVDIAAPHGTKVVASANGVVKERGYDPGGKGRYLILRHDYGFETAYFHLHRRYVEEGQQVPAGRRIGAEGETGRSTGPHLHFEIRKNNVALDPATFIPSLRKN